MVTIRLTRRGAKKQPFYHVVVTDSRMRQGGTTLEQVGYFNPIPAGKQRRLELNLDAHRLLGQQGREAVRARRRAGQEASQAGRRGLIDAASAAERR